MADLRPETVLNLLDEGRLHPFYLFFGESAFFLEQVLNRIRENYIPAASRDFNVHIFYIEKNEGSGSSAADVLDAARSLPFMADHRLIIVRRTENLTVSSQEAILPYLDNPVDSNCLIFVASKTDFKRKFYKKIRECGCSVHFKKMNDWEVVRWLKKTATGLGLHMEDEAAYYLVQVVGNRLRDLYSEVEKLSLRYGETNIDLKKVKEFAIHSRIHTIFEVMDHVSFKRCYDSISALTRYLEEEGQEEVLKVLGMLNRQIGLLWGTKSVLDAGGSVGDVMKKLKIRDFQAKKLVQQAGLWKESELQGALESMYMADHRIKSGSQGPRIIENIILSLCR